MSEERVPYLRPPFTLVDGRVSACDLEESIRANIRLILHNYVQGQAKPPGVAALPDYGADLPHHEFRRGRVADVVREVRVALRRLEPRLSVEKIEFNNDEPGRYLPYDMLKIGGKVLATGKTVSFDFRVEE